MKEVYPNISEEEIGIMKQLLSSGQIQHKYAIRLQTVINRAQRKSTNEIASYLGINITTVSSYVNRFNEGGLPILLRDKTRLPGKEKISEATKNEVCRLTCTEKPEGKSHWSSREIAQRVGISRTSVQEIWKERGLKPHRVKSFQYSKDPAFEQKLEDVVGLYMNPPVNAVILCVDEKSQIQALERSQPILPLREGVPERQSHDYYRHGITTLFAALNVMTGNVIGECKDTHTSGEYISFLKKLDTCNPKGKVLHIVIDNYATHKTEKVKEYIASMNGRFVEHFIPTHSSWLNLVERWFAEITNKSIRRGSFSGLEELKKTIRTYIKHWNKNPKPFKWTKSAERISNSILLSSIYTI